MKGFTLIELTMVIAIIGILAAIIIPAACTSDDVYNPQPVDSGPPP